MKKSSRILLIALSAALVATFSVLGTLAFLTSQGEVINTFTVGNVNITLDEAQVTTSGQYAVDENTRVKSNEYHLIPGARYIKDPRVTVEANSEPAYIRMLVTVNELSDLKAALKLQPNELFLPQYHVEGWDPAVWVPVDVRENGDDTATYEFHYHTVTTASPAAQLLPPLFTHFTVPGMMNNADLLSIQGFKITVVAHAIQAQGFDNAQEAWLNFDQQMAAEATPQPSASPAPVG